SDADTPADARFSAPDAGCDVSPAPSSVPALAGGFAVLGDGGMPEAATGGDPIGTWGFEHVTVWVPQSSTSMFMPTTSTVDGSAWAAFDGTNYRLYFDLVMTYNGTAVGTLVRASTTIVRGTYVVSGSSLDVVRTCAYSNLPQLADAGPRDSGPSDATILG